MKTKIIFSLTALLLSCSLIFAQNGGIPVELKPLNPPNKPPFGNIFNPNDSDIVSNKPTSLIIKKDIFECYQNATHLTLSCNIDEAVSIVVYEMLSGVKHTSTLNMVAGEVYSINTPWGAGLYTIRLTLTDGTILEGDFQIR